MAACRHLARSVRWPLRRPAADRRHPIAEPGDRPASRWYAPHRRGGLAKNEGSLAFPPEHARLCLPCPLLEPFPALMKSEPGSSFRFDAFSSREPVATSLENALILEPKHDPTRYPFADRLAAVRRHRSDCPDRSVRSAVAHSKLDLSDLRQDRRRHPGPQGIAADAGSGAFRGAPNGCGSFA